ncbi:MAG: hypothetical protein WCH43_02875 [Verrucomicrobiota bacterium]
MNAGFEHAGRFADGFGKAEAGDGCISGVCPLDHPLAVGNDNGVCRGFECAALQSQLGFRLSALSDVPHDAQEEFLSIANDAI